MRTKKHADWIPFYHFSWLFGSTRHELVLRDNGNIIDLRGIWMDLLSMACMNMGYIEANETTPVPLEQLAGQFLVPKDLLIKTIDICLKVGKLKDLGDGRYFAPSYEKYALSSRYLRKLSHPGGDEKDDNPEHGSDNPEHGSGKPDPGGEGRGEDRTGTSPPTPPLRGGATGEPDTFDEFFDNFWDAWLKKVHKDDARDALLALEKKGVPRQEIIDAVNGYQNHVSEEARKKHRELKEHLNFTMNPATFLRRNRWRDYIGIKKTVRL